GAPGADGDQVQDGEGDGGTPQRRAADLVGCGVVCGHGGVPPVSRQVCRAGRSVVRVGLSCGAVRAAARRGTCAARAPPCRYGTGDSPRLFPGRLHRDRPGAAAPGAFRGRRTGMPSGAAPAGCRPGQPTVRSRSFLVRPRCGPGTRCGPDAARVRSRTTCLTSTPLEVRASAAVPYPARPGGPPAPAPTHGG